MFPEERRQFMECVERMAMARDRCELHQSNGLLKLSVLPFFKSCAASFLRLLEKNRENLR